jgi:ribosomal protein L1
MRLHRSPGGKTAVVEVIQGSSDVGGPRYDKPPINPRVEFTLPHVEGESLRVVVYAKQQHAMGLTDAYATWVVTLPESE